VNITSYFNADTYYSGSAAKDYLDESLFEKQGIQVKYQNYIHPVYDQLNNGFIPYMSIIDLLFHHGKECIEVLKVE
jgi:hypothetical protein